MQSEHTPSISFTGEDLHISYGGPKIIEGLNVTIPNGEVTAIIGPNGCGKSTLLRALARILTPDKGIVFLDGTDIGNIPTREVARKLGILTQNQRAPEAVSVSDLVICKCGYGFVSECISNKIPFFYLSDRKHREQNAISKQLSKKKLGKKISLNQLNNLEFNEKFFLGLSKTRKIHLENQKTARIILKLIEK